MAINSNLQCPITNNIPSLRFIDPKMLGVVSGAMTCNTIYLNNFFVPISNWSFNIVTLKPGEIKRIDISNIQSLGDRKEYYTFNLDSFFNTSPVVSSVVTLIVTSGTTEILTFNTGTTVAEFIVNANIAIRGNTNLTGILYCELNTENTIKIYSNTIGVAYTYNMSINSGTPDLTITPVLLQSHIRYPNGRIKVIFLMIDYDETLASNLKHVEYSFDDDYQENLLNTTFRKFGKMFFLTSDDDVDETDTNLIETVWVKNPQTFNVTIKTFIAS